MFPHDCPSCQCTDQLKAWLEHTLIPTPGGKAYTGEIWLDYLGDPISRAPSPHANLGQSSLTRAIRAYGYRLDNRGGKGNYVVGYTNP